MLSPCGRSWRICPGGGNHRHKLLVSQLSSTKKTSTKKTTESTPIAQRHKNFWHFDLPLRAKIFILTAPERRLACLALGSSRIVVEKRGCGGRCKLQACLDRGRALLTVEPRQVCSCHDAMKTKPPCDCGQTYYKQHLALWIRARMATA